MEKMAFEVRNVSKRYGRDAWALKNVSLALPEGCVMGLVGENGAGKTTLIRLLLGTLARSEGDIRVLGGAPEDTRVRAQIGLVLGENFLPATLRAGDVGRVLAGVYGQWDKARYAQLLRDFGIDPKKEISKLSRGMQMKLQIATALSHGARLLIFDEATSGLDPVVRDEVLMLLRDFLQDEHCSVLLSSHITSDLDKIADYIAFIHQGEVLFSQRRDELLDTMGVARLGEQALGRLPRELIARVQRDDYGATVLLRDRRAASEFGVTSERASIEEIMLLTLRGEEMPL